MPYIPSESHTQRQPLDIWQEDTFASLSEEVEGIRRTLEMYANARPVSSYYDNGEEELERDQEEERLNRNRHLRPTTTTATTTTTTTTTMDDETLLSDWVGTTTSSSRFRPENLGFPDGRRRTIVRRNRPSRLSQALSATSEHSDGGNRYQFILNGEAPTAATVTSEELDRIDNEDYELLSYLNGSTPLSLPEFNFEEVPGDDDDDYGSQRTFVRRLLQPQGNGISWLLAEIRQAGTSRRRSRLSTMTTASENRTIHSQISSAFEQIEAERSELLGTMRRNQERLLNGADEEEDDDDAIEDGGMSDTTVTPSSALLTESVVNRQVQFMLQLQRIQEQIGVELDRVEVGDRDQLFQLPTSEERHTFQRLSRNYENSFRDATSEDIVPPVFEPIRSDMGSSSLLSNRPHRTSAGSTKLMMAKSVKHEMQSKAVSWVRGGVEFSGRIIDPGSLSADILGGHKASFQVCWVDAEKNEVSCTLSKSDGSRETHERWRGEMLEGPHDGRADHTHKLYNLTSHWQQLYPNHTLNGTSMMWKVQGATAAGLLELKGSPHAQDPLEYASPREMQAKAVRDYVWLLLTPEILCSEGSRERERERERQRERQLLLSVRRSDGSLEGCIGQAGRMGRPGADTKLVCMRPSRTSIRGLLPDISLR